MRRLRLLVCLFALVALAAPPGGLLGGSSAAARTMAVDCPDHLRVEHRVPDPCPDRDSARHAAGLCCPLMAGAIAVIAMAPGLDAAPLPALPASPAGRFRPGRLFTQDPPPPRA